MEFRHRYGPVELHLEHEHETGDVLVLARYVAPIRQAVLGPVFDSDAGRPTDFNVYARESCPLLDGERPGEYEYGAWRRHAPGKTYHAAEVWDTRNSPTESETPFNPEVLEAAYTLLMDDQTSFEEAERAMGDPSP